VKNLLLFLAIAAAANLGTVLVLPWLVNAWVMHKIAAKGGENVALPAPRADASARTVVRPSPDMLYTACVFDISQRPLHIRAPVQDSYVSVAAFAADTSNFFAVNDSALAPGPDGKKHFDLVIARDVSATVPAGARLILAPSDRGLILFRSLIPHEADLPHLLEVQSRQECRSL
jgi:uncharacterized membrane protein